MNATVEELLEDATGTPPTPNLPAEAAGEGGSPCRHCLSEGRVSTMFGGSCPRCDRHQCGQCKQPVMAPTATACPCGAPIKPLPQQVEL